MGGEEVPQVAAGSRWVTRGGDELEVLAVGQKTAFVRLCDEYEGAYSLTRFADGTFTPAPPPKPTPKKERWVAVTLGGVEIIFSAETSAWKWARENGGAWVAPLVPDMDAAEWVEP